MNIRPSAAIRQSLFFDFLKSQIHIVNKNDIDMIKVILQVFYIRLHQLRFPGTPNSCNDFYIGGIF